MLKVLKYFQLILMHIRCKSCWGEQEVYVYQGPWTQHLWRRGDKGSWAGGLFSHVGFFCSQTMREESHGFVTERRRWGIWVRVWTGTNIYTLIRSLCFSVNSVSVLLLVKKKRPFINGFFFITRFRFNPLPFGLGPKEKKVSSLILIMSQASRKQVHTHILDLIPKGPNKPRISPL